MCYIDVKSTWENAMTASNDIAACFPHLSQITDGSMCFKSFEAVLYIMT